MSKSKGFTLIELLAVIAVLAIVLLIAVPTILNMIERARKGAFQDNALGALKSSQNYVGYFNIGVTGYKLEFDDGQAVIDISELDLEKSNLKGFLIIDKNESNYTYKVNAWDGTYRICNSNYVNMNEIEKSNEPCEEYVVIRKDESGASVPNLHSNMIPVKWDEGNKIWVKADKSNPIDNRWFDYSIYQWANAVTVTSGTRTAYKKATVGTPVLEADILTYMVWIPRYSYILFNANNGAVDEQRIEITFESKDTPPSCGENECTPNRIYSTGENGTPLTHPAFTFGDEELDGFWVGKFEMSSQQSCTAASSSPDGSGCNISTNNPLIKPNVTSWRGIQISNMYTVLKNMNKAKNIYGYSDSVDTHMIKNMEWGAVAYLSQSKYGKNGNTSYTGVNQEIYKNNSSYMTGRSGGAPGGYQELWYGYEEEPSGFFSYDGKCVSTTHSKCNSGGQQLTGNDLHLAYGASTTGTIYGVYDMSGGTYEYVMAAIYQSDSTSLINISSSGFQQSYIDSKDMEKYIDKYEYGTNKMNYTRGRLGDGTKETLKTLGAIEGNGGWYGDYSIFPCYDTSWFFRGGWYGDKQLTGIWYFDDNNGNAYVGYSSRLTHP